MVGSKLKGVHAKKHIYIYIQNKIWYYTTSFTLFLLFINFDFKNTNSKNPFIDYDELTLKTF